MKKTFWGLELFFLILSFTACASNPKSGGRGDLCGFVIDENNRPIGNFVISARRNKGLWNHTITNDEGLFVFPDALFGNYSFQGSKNYFMKLQESNCPFYDKGKIYCFQVNSIDKAFDEVEQMIFCTNFERAEGILNQIAVGRQSSGEELIEFYRNYIKIASEDDAKEMESYTNEKS